MSVSFDRAAPYYDQTRALPDDVMGRLADLLADRMRHHPRTLEIGVGTGRYAVPLRARGVRISGVDISAAMLARLHEKDARLPVARGDATRLPFRDRAFGSVLAVHVLHLVPAWRRAVAEIARVLTKGGLFFVDAGSGDNPVEKKFFELAGAPGRAHPGLTDLGDLDAEMHALGARREPLPPLEYVHVIRLAEYIEQLSRGAYSRCWELHPETLRRAGEETRAWAAQLVGDLEAPLQVERTIAMRAYRVP